MKCAEAKVNKIKLGKMHSGFLGHPESNFGVIEVILNIMITTSVDSRRHAHGNSLFENR